MATQFDPIAKDESLNTTEVTPRNIADVIAEGLKGIEDALPTYTEGDGIDISALKEISVDTTFNEASTRANIASGDSFSTILGKIKKFFTDLKTVAFTGAYSDLSGTPNLTNVAYKNVNNQFSASQNIDAKNGTTSTVGYTDLNIGNNVAAGTAGNSTGVLRLYGNSGSSVALLADNATAARQVRLPDADGTIALTDLIKYVDVPGTTNGNGDISLSNSFDGFISGQCLTAGINASFRRASSGLTIVAHCTDNQNVNVVGQSVVVRLWYYN